MAKANGIFAKYGLDVDIKPSNGSLESLEAVANGSDTFGNVAGDVIIKAAAKGSRVVMVFAEYPSAGNAIVVLDSSNITQPTDLIGKTVGMPTNTSTYQEWSAYLAAGNISADAIKVVNLQASALVGALAAGRVDGIGTLPAATLPSLDSAGKTGRALYFSDAGIDLMGIGMTVKPSTISDNPDLVRRMVAAMSESMQYASQHPQEAAAALVKYNPEAHQDLTQKIWENFFNSRDSANTKGQPIGWISDKDWTKTEDILQRYGALTTPVDVSTLYTNEFLPK